MMIVPSGRRRFMVAQAPAAAEMGLDEIGAPPVEAPPDPVATPEEQTPEQGVPDEVGAEAAPEEIGQEDQSEIKGGKQSLRKFVEQFYSQVLKFPPRAVMKHKEDIVQRDVDSELQSAITIVIPNEYYGTGEEFDRRDVGKFAKTMKEKFGLFFLQAKDDGKVWKMDFQTQAPESDIDPEELGEDPLSQYLGKGNDMEDSDKKRLKRTAARTVHELVKDNKDHVYEEMLKVIQRRNK